MWRIVSGFLDNLLYRESYARFFFIGIILLVVATFVRTMRVIRAMPGLNSQRARYVTAPINYPLVNSC